MREEEDLASHSGAEISEKEVMVPLVMIGNVCRSSDAEVR